MAASTCVHVTCGLLAVLAMTSLVTSESSSAERGGGEETAAAVEALARALQHYGHSAGHLPGAPAADWAEEQKREAALDVDYGWGGGRFGKRRMADRLGIAGRFGRSVDVVARRSAAAASRTHDNDDH